MSFDYEIQGVKLTDPRGGWSLRPGTDVLPKYPGIRVTRFNVPGASGESQVQHAPLEPVKYLFRVRFHPVDTRIESPRYLKRGRDYEERIANLERNINEFMFSTRLGAQSHLGNVELRRLNPASQDASSDSRRFSHGVMTAVGRVIASTDPDVSPSGTFAEYEFIYENQTGTWFTEWDYRKGGLKQAGFHGYWVPCGTAPIDDAMIAIYPAVNDMPAGVLVRNEAGIGFEVKKALTPNRWHIFDTKAWSVGATPGIWWSTPKPDKTSMTEYGRPTGSALTITPGIKNVDSPRGILTVRLTGPGYIRTATRPRWF